MNILCYRVLNPTSRFSSILPLYVRVCRPQFTAKVNCFVDSSYPSNADFHCLSASTFQRIPVLCGWFPRLGSFLPCSVL